jgi:mannose-1-phosphate guanylyltransferase / mannose-6-phosphate isomerase
MSRRSLPKQFLPLVSERSMLQDTVLRLTGLDTSAPLIVSNNEHRFLVAEQLRDISIVPSVQILEPVGRNTAPAVAAAALWAIEHDPSAVLIVLPADHLIREVYRFHESVQQAIRLANAGMLVTFGITPDHPATGFGYIERGEAICDVAGAYSVARFVEKPEQARAEEFIATGRYAWNSGMFTFGAARFLEELGKHRPDILAGARAASEQAKRDLDFLRLDGQAFAACPAESIDFAVMEKTDAAAVIPVDIGWSDVGSWSTLWEVGEKDARGNVVRGDVHLSGAENCYVRAESRMVSVLGMKDAVIVETDDALLVADQAAAQKVKDIVGHLDGAHRTEHLTHTRVYRPWGYYESIDAGDRFQVKRIMVKPGAALSLQMHHHRAEHWIVVSGTARVTRGDEVTLLAENESTYIPIGTKHRLENPGKVPLFLIEVQSGGYLGEDDIVRFEDLYRRD